MQAALARPHSVDNPFGLSIAVVAVSAGLAAVGIGGFIAGAVTVQRTKDGEADPDPPPGELPQLKAMIAVATGGGAGQATEGDEEIMRHGSHGGTYTSFFNTRVESEIASRLQAYKNRRKIKDGECKKVMRYVPDKFGGMNLWVGYQEAFDATQEILTSLYPNGSPWNAAPFIDVMLKDTEQANKRSWEVAEEEGMALWRWWLWNRVNIMATGPELCGYVPVT